MRWTLALLLIFSRARAADSVGVVIDRAQTLAAAKKRGEATAMLRRALDANTPRAQRARLREALGQVARVFFTDQGQRAFETGQAELFENPDAAAVRLRDALTHEDGNVVVRLTLAKFYLLKQNCAAARAEITGVRAMNPEDADAAALELRAMACDHAYNGMREKVRALPPLGRWQTAFVNYVQARAWLHEGAGPRAAEALARVNVDFPRFPEAYYYAARAEGARGAGEDALRKYVGLCRGITGRDRREFALEPRACARLKEAEDELANKSSDL